ncbi:MAG: hypothetical protein JW940_10330 [Polyangiaceae bacterium]|nr:hypothetical protein [Polyangiaceae bacterium]
MHVPFAIYLPYLLLTLVIEGPLVLGLLVRRCGWQRSLLVALLASLLTHPLLWFVWSRVVSPRAHYSAYVASGEGLVWLIEAGVFFFLALWPTADRARSRTNRPARLAGIALGVSLAANLASWATGALLHELGLLRPLVMTAARGIDAVLAWPQ